MADQQLVLHRRMEVEPFQHRMEEEMRSAEENEVRMVLVGKTGCGKSSTGNTILGKEAFGSELDFNSKTEECQKETAEFDGKILAVVDTPGLYDTSRSLEEVQKEIARCISFVAPGPHAFLILIRPGRFTKEEKKTVKIIQKIFGEQAAAYTMVVFTHGDEIKKKGKSIEDLISRSPAVHDIIGQCGGGYHVINNEEEDSSQVRELLEKIDTMVSRNKERIYTNEVLQEARRVILETMLSLLRENLQLRMEEARRLAERNNAFLHGFMRANKATATVMMGTAAGACVGAFGGPVGAVAGAAIGTVVGGVCAAAMLVKDICVIQ